MVNLGHFLIQVFHRNIACIVSFNLTLIVGRVNDSVGQLDIIDMQKKCNDGIFRFQQLYLPVKLRRSITLIITDEIIHGFVDKPMFIYVIHEHIFTIHLSLNITLMIDGLFRFIIII